MTSDRGLAPRLLVALAGIALATSCGPMPVQQEGRTAASWKLSRERTQQRIAQRQDERDDEKLSSSANDQVASFKAFAAACPGADRHAQVHIVVDDLDPELQRVLEGSDRAARLALLLKAASGSCPGASVIERGQSVALFIDRPCGRSEVHGRVGFDVSRSGVLGIDVDAMAGKAGTLDGQFKLTGSIRPRAVCVTGRVSKFR